MRVCRLLAIVLIGLFIFILAVELYLRSNPFYCGYGATRELSWFRQNFDFRKYYTIDPEFEFRPIFEDGFYNQYGTLSNNYPFKKRPLVTRLLFIGDSVTREGTIIDGLKELYKEDAFEYWNAGVGSFNTVQELRYYKKFNYVLKADHVILTFHLNDFGTTPVIFMGENGKLLIFDSYLPVKNVNAFLFEHSMLYRFYLGILRGSNSRIEAAIENDTFASLKELRDILAKDNIRFTVIIHPTNKRYDKWNRMDKQARAKILNILQRLGIRFFDLTEVIDDAINSKVAVKKDNPWHPTKEMGGYFAAFLYQKGLLANN